MCFACSFFFLFSRTDWAWMARAELSSVHLASWSAAATGPGRVPASQPPRPRRLRLQPDPDCDWHCDCAAPVVAWATRCRSSRSIHPPPSPTAEPDPIHLQSICTPHPAAFARSMLRLRAYAAAACAHLLLLHQRQSNEFMQSNVSFGTFNSTLSFSIISRQKGRARSRACLCAPWVSF